MKSGPLQAQSAWHSISNANSIKLRELATKITQKGYFERMITMGYVSSPRLADKNRPLWFRNENTYLFYRFKFDTGTIGQENNYLIGKVFVSERVNERDYREHHVDSTDYLNDVDGVTYYCKLYYDRKSNEFRVNIYPEYMENICREKIHGNRHTCVEVNKDNGFENHQLTLTQLVKIPDIYYTDFIPTAVDDSGLRDLFANTSVNVVRRNDIADSAFKKGLEKIQNINFSKHIKCFSFGSADLAGPEIGDRMQLVFTKYPFSDDLLEHHSYELNMVSYSEVPGKLASGGGAYLTRNNWNVSLLVSDSPDDFLFNDLNKKPDSWYLLRNGRPFSLKSGDREIEMAEIEKSGLKKEKTRLDSIRATLLGGDAELKGKIKAMEEEIGKLTKELALNQSKNLPDTSKLKQHLDDVMIEGKGYLSDIQRASDSLTTASADTSQIEITSKRIEGLVRKIESLAPVLLSAQEMLFAARTEIDRIIQTRKALDKRLEEREAEKRSLASNHAKLSAAFAKNAIDLTANVKKQNDVDNKLAGLLSANPVPRKDSLWIYFGKYKLGASELFEAESMFKSSTRSPNILNNMFKDLLTNKKIVNTIAIRDAAPVVVDGNFFRGNLQKVYEVRYDKLPQGSLRRKYPHKLHYLFNEDSGDVYVWDSHPSLPQLKYQTYQYFNHEGYRYYWVKLERSTDL